MPKGWSKGFTKKTHPSIRKRFETMKARHIDNFLDWRKKMIRCGRIRSDYPDLKKNSDLAELIGVILGDGHIRKFARVDELSVFSNSNNPGFVKRYSRLIENFFDKKPSTTLHSGKNCIRIRIYQKNIQSRLNVPYSPRKNKHIKIPGWISRNKQNTISYLRGLYEAEGSYSIHLPTYTYKLSFSNKNKSMLNNVFCLMKKLKFNPHLSLKNYSVQLSRKDEVLKAIAIIGFRSY